jgi:hypothetical protein
MFYRTLQGNLDYVYSLFTFTVWPWLLLPVNARFGEDNSWLHKSDSIFFPNIVRQHQKTKATINRQGGRCMILQVMSAVQLLAT